MVAFHFARAQLSEANPLEPQLIKFEKKVEAGAEFVQT